MNDGISVSATEESIRGQVAALLTHHLSVVAFHDWFFGALWDIEQSASDDDVSLAATVENRLAEYTGGYISEEALRDALLDDARAILAAPATGLASA